MSDPDVERELGANRRRDEGREERADTDPAAVDAAEELIDPIMRPLTGDVDGDTEEDNLDAEQRRLNDEAQRRD